MSFGGTSGAGGVGALGLGLESEFGFRATPSLVTFTRLLALPQHELEAVVAREVSTNPALDRVAAPTCAGCGRPVGRRHLCPTCSSRPVRQRAAPVPGADGQPEPRAGGSWRERILSEVAPLLPDGDRPLAAYLLADLDDRGLLGRDPDEEAAALGVPGPRLRGVIDAIRAVGPPGVCGRDGFDCLRLQLDAWERARPAPPLVRELLGGERDHEHLADLAAGRLPAVARALGATVAAVAEALAFVRAHLRPFAVVEEDEPEGRDQAVADVAVRMDPGDPPRLVVHALDAVRLGLRVDPVYARLATAGPGGGPPPTLTLTSSEHEEVVEDVRRARALLDQLDRRTRTLEAVTRTAAQHQVGFLCRGPAAHLPLTQAVVARRLGLHESTVSRAVRGKTVLLPRGIVVPLADLFGSNAAVLDRLRALVAQETAPLSDGELAQRLAAAGRPVARRTVAKYRSLLGIPPSSLR